MKLLEVKIFKLIFELKNNYPLNLKLEIYIFINYHIMDFSFFKGLFDFTDGSFHNL